MSPLLAFNRKLPSKSVMVPLVVPFTITLAPIIGSPVVSLTIPLTTIYLEKYLLKTIQPFYLLFYNLLIPFNFDLSFTSLMLIA